jgi:ketosteroid isomerase-like protein
MSEKAVEVARRVFDEASRVKDPSGRQIDALDPETLAVVYDSFDPEIELHEDPSFPEGGVYRGFEATRRYFSQFTESFDEFSFEIEDLIDLGGDRVLVLFRLRTRGKGSGATAEASPGWIYTFRAGKVVHLEAYLDRSEAFKAAGLGDQQAR